MPTQLASIILYSLNLFFALVLICVAVSVLFRMMCRRSIVHDHRIIHLLYANTYITLLFIGGFLIDMSAYSIYGLTHTGSFFNGWWCIIKSYFLYIGGVTFFHSFALQAIYQLCRILHPTRVRLHSFRLYLILSIGLWILVAFELLSSLLIGHLEYLPNEYHCQLSPANIRASITVVSIGFFFPFGVTVFCYRWTMSRVRQQTAALTNINQQASIRRDLVIFKRLVILLTFVTMVAVPHIIFPIMYVRDGYLPSWIVPLEWVLTSLALVIVSIVLPFVSPHLKKLWIRTDNIHPIMAVALASRH